MPPQWSEPLLNLTLRGGSVVQSIVDCNHSFRVTTEELLQKLQAGLAREKSPMPCQILARLRQGILASPLVADEVKELLRQNGQDRPA